MGNGCSGVRSLSSKLKRKNTENTPRPHLNGKSHPTEEDETEDELTALSPVSHLGSNRGLSAASSTLVLPGTSISFSSPMPESLSELESFKPLPDLEEFPDDIRHLLLGHFEGYDFQDNLRDIYLLVVTNGDEGLRFYGHLETTVLRTLQALALRNESSLHIHLIGYPPLPCGHGYRSMVNSFVRDLLDNDTVIVMVLWGGSSSAPQPPEELSAEAFDMTVGRTPSAEWREALHCAYAADALVYRLRPCADHARVMDILREARAHHLITSAFEDSLTLLEDCEEQVIAGRTFLFRLDPDDHPTLPVRLTGWEQRLPEDHVFRFREEEEGWTEVEDDEEGGDNPLEGLECRLRHLMGEIFSEFSDRTPYYADVAGKGVWSELRSELIQQRAAARRHLRRFRGRSTLVRAASVAASGAPLVVRGRPGCGKSALMAAAAARCSALYPDAPLLLRAAGAGPEAATLERLLRSVCEQLALLYGENPAVASRSIAEHNALFGALLGRACAERPLALFLDGLEQVSECSGRSLLWFPSHLPPHVRLVVALRRDSRELLELEERLPADCFLDVPDLPIDEGAPDRESVLSLLSCVPPLFLSALCTLRHGVTEDEMRDFLRADEPEEDKLQLTMIRVKQQLDPYVAVQVRRGRKFTVLGSQWFRDLCLESLGQEQLELGTWSCLRYFGGDSDDDELREQEPEATELPKCAWKWRCDEEALPLRLHLGRPVRSALLQGLTEGRLEGGDVYPLLEAIKLYKRANPDDREVDALARVLRGAAHALRHCPRQLPDQLRVRADPEAVARLPLFRRLFRLLKPSLTARGAPCVRTLSDHLRPAPRAPAVHPLERLCWSQPDRLATVAASGEVAEWDAIKVQKLWFHAATEEPLSAVGLCALPTAGEVLVLHHDDVRVVSAAGGRGGGEPVDATQGVAVIDGGRGALVLSRSRDEILRLDLRSGHVAARIPLGEERLGAGLVVSGDGESAAVGDALQKPFPVRVWDVRSGLLLRHFALRHHELDVRLAALSADGDMLYIAAKDLLSSSASFLLGLDVRGGGVAWEAHLGAPVCALALGGRTLIAATREGRLCALQPLDGSERWSLRMAHCPVTRIEMVEDVFLTWDPLTRARTITLWNTLKGTQLVIFTTDFDITECSLSPDGTRIALLIVGKDRPTVLTLTSN